MQIFNLPNAPDDFIKLAIEFWIVIANEEYEILEEIATCEENEIPVPKNLVSENYIAGINK